MHKGSNTAVQDWCQHVYVCVILIRCHWSAHRWHCPQLCTQSRAWIWMSLF